MGPLECRVSPREHGLRIPRTFCGTSEGALRVAIHRFRKRYRDLLRAEIAQTVESPEEVDEELRFLAGALNPK
jgi:hypothetical protein